MKFPLVLAAYLVVCPGARAHDACERSYAALKKFEADNAAWRATDADEGLRTASSLYICDPARVASIKRDDAYMAKVSSLARNFVQACANSSDHEKDVAEYNAPYFRMPPSGIEKTCAILGR